MPDEKLYQGIVQKVITNGHHGPYVVARCEELNELITFSLKECVWKENDWPEEGMYVVLSKLRKKRSGWRAMQALFERPSIG
ncbi:hypothetical protein CL632_03085 [bacterium]|jgi:hypothetical protein|nr:hypothetical protein [bacterium]MDP6571622.1 hypothetical protein [Patescibacteria group bacterium]|tara:strand:+ start:1138 stop:1383 length:246 start_codon:yes stop_codon:yes gene_type:complete